MSDGGEESGKVVLIPLKVRDVIVKEVISVDGESTVKEAVDIMNEFHIGSLIVLGKGKATGIVTERDFLKRVIGEARDVSKTKVKEIMTTPLAVADPDMDLEEAVKLMFQKGIKKLAVIDAGKLVGIVTLTDIARYQPQMMQVLKQLSAKQTAPENIQKVINYYIV